MKTSPEEAQQMREFAESLGVEADSVEGFVEEWTRLADAAMEAPKNELLYRLNCSVQGIDPGLPMNWPGERGLR